MSLQRLRNLGMMQKNFMWKIAIPAIPGIGVNNLEFLARAITVPGKTMSKDQVRYLDQYFNQPSGTTFDGEATITVLLEEGHTVYDTIMKWFKFVKENSVGLGVEAVKADVNISFLGLDKATVTKRIQFLGCFPISKPEIGGLEQDSTEGFITFDLQLAVDDVDYDENNILSF